MSRRISFKSEIKDPDLAATALKQLDMGHRQIGPHSIEITSGALRGATIDLKTGEVVGDSDYHGGMLGGLRQAYSEAEFTRQAQRQGSTIESRRVTEQGDVKILCRMVG